MNVWNAMNGIGSKSQKQKAASCASWFAVGTCAGIVGTTTLYLWWRRKRDAMVEGSISRVYTEHGTPSDIWYFQKSKA